MNQVKWFKRTFDFSGKQNIFPSIMERLADTSLRLEHKIASIPPVHLTKRCDNTWSIQENVGHLADLEPLWQGRLVDILANEKYLRPTDLANGKTHEANHNERNVDDILAEFSQLRLKTLLQLKELSEEDIFRNALHPRLETPMRTMDLFLFVAEHDDHHLARMSEIARLLVK